LCSLFSTHRRPRTAPLFPYTTLFRSPARLDETNFDAVLFEGDGDALRDLNRRLAARSGPIISVQGLTSDSLAQGASYALEPLLRERAISINTAAAGGNASLMTIG